MRMRFFLFLSIAILFCFPCLLRSQETLYLHIARSKGDTVVYKREVSFDSKTRLYHVRDVFESGQVEMEATYSALDKSIKEDYQCNYRTNTKEGHYREWYPGGQIKYDGYFRKGRRNGICFEWSQNGQLEAEEHWKNGQLNGRTRYWSEDGQLKYDLDFRNGENKDKKTVKYNYLAFLPEGYDNDTLRRWPLAIYLHGGSDRGSDLKKLYSSGIPDQLYRGRKFPFIVVAPQCPLGIRWETENWFEPLYDEITRKYRIDGTRVYLTGFSLGGSGTWYIAARYPDIFAAIAPVSGFTSHNAYLGRHLARLKDMPVWAFHGRPDLTVPFGETESIVNKLRKNNSQVKFTADPVTGHWIHWNIYPGRELYDWFLTNSKQASSNK